MVSRRDCLTVHPVPPLVPAFRFVRAADDGFAMHQPDAAGNETMVADEPRAACGNLTQSETLLASVMIRSYLAFAVKALAPASCAVKGVSARLVYAVFEGCVWQLNRLATV